MAQIIDFLKKEKTEDGSRSDFDSLKRRHRVLVMYKILGVAAVIAIILVIVYFQYQSMTYTSYDSIRSIEYNEVPSAKYLNYNGNVLRYSTDGASAFSVSGDYLWNQTYEMQTPIVDSCDDYVGIGDYKGTTIYVMNSAGKQGEVDTTLPIETFAIAGNGNVAVVLEEDNITYIKLFNKDGALIATDRTSMANSGYPIDVSLSSNGSIMAVSYLFIDNGTMSSSVAFYNFGAVGQNEIDNLVSGYNYSGSVMSYVQFMNEKVCFAVADDKMVIYTGSQKPEEVKPIEYEEEVRSVFYNKDYVGLVFRTGTSDATYRLDVYNTSGELAYSKGFNTEYKDIVFNKDCVIIYSTDELQIYTMDEVEKFRGEFTSPVIDVIPVKGQTQYLLVHGNKTEEIKLKR